MTKIFFPIASYLFMTSAFLYSGENTAKANRVYAGPEILWLDFNTNVYSAHVEGKTLLAGLAFQYEFLKPKAFYAGIDWLVAAGNKGFSSNWPIFPLDQDDGVSLFVNLEARFGRTHSFSKYWVTPFLGFGTYGMISGHHHAHFCDAMVYIAGGLRNLFLVTTRFNVGLNLKILGLASMKELRHYTVCHTDTEFMGGGEISLPLIWKMGSTKWWSIQFEPYYLRFNFQEAQNIYGASLLFGFHI